MARAPVTTEWPARCCYAWPGNSRRRCEERPDARVTLDSGLMVSTVCVCQTHVADVERRHRGITTTKVVRVEWRSTQPELVTDQEVRHYGEQEQGH